MTTFSLPWRGGLIGAYYATLPGRMLINASAARNAKAPVMVIYYHRVADRKLNDWTISNTQFKREVDWLEANFDLVSLDEAQRRIREGNTRASVSITFDDGYAENCERASVAHWAKDTLHLLCDKLLAAGGQAFSARRRRWNAISTKFYRATSFARSGGSRNRRPHAVARRSGKDHLRGTTAR